jgi:hypothetical protein
MIGMQTHQHQPRTIGQEHNDWKNPTKKDKK